MNFMSLTTAVAAVQNYGVTAGGSIKTLDVEYGPIANLVYNMVYNMV
jgi:hypothetical protein